MRNFFTFHKTLSEADRIKLRTDEIERIRLARACKANNRAKALVAQGYGWEDLCVKTKISRQAARRLLDLD